MGNLSPSVETLIRTLVAAKDAPFPESFRPSSRGPDFTQNLDNHQLRLARKSEAISETHGSPVIFLKFRKNHGKSTTVCGDPISNPNRG